MEVVDQRSSTSCLGQKADGWPECFQDLRSWCHPDQDELNTPQITMQDEFNFTLDGQVNNGSWGLVQSPVESWVNQDLLLASPNNLVTDEENNNFDIQNNFSSAYMKGDSYDLAISQAGKQVEEGSANPSVLKTKGNVLLSQVTVLSEDIRPSYPKLNSSITTIGSDVSLRLGSGGRLIKQEAPEAEPAIGQRPKLQLSIPPPPGQQVCDITTPDVLKPLTDLTGTGFDLLNYVCGDSENGSKMATIVTKKESEGDISIQDHDYIDKMSRDGAVMDDDDDDLNNTYIKCEPMSPDHHMEISSAVTGRVSVNSSRPSIDDDDFMIDSFDEDMDEEEDEWFPSGSSRSSGRRQGAGKRRGRQASVSSDASGIQDRYRALRDRNNEASRRSRLNRKQRDLEMRRNKSELEKKNVELRVKADRMEALVKDMRAILLKAVRSRAQQQQANH